MKHIILLLATLLFSIALIKPIRAQVACPPSSPEFADVDLEAWKYASCAEVLNGQPPTDQRQVWVGTMSKSAGVGGTFSFVLSVPASNGTPADVNWLEVQSSVGNLSPAHIGFYDNSFSFSIPADNSTSVTISIYQNQDLTCCAQSGSGSACSASGALQAPAFSLTNLRFTTAAPNNTLASPQVADAGVCNPGETVNLLVTPTQPGVEYNWYADQTSTTILHTGSSYSYIPTASEQLYVQAVPSTIYACPSSRKSVNVHVYTTAASFSLDTGYSGPPPYLTGYAVKFDAQPGYDNYSWDWGDHSAPESYAGTNTATHFFKQSGSWDVKLTVTKAHPDVTGGTCSATVTLRGVVTIAPLCEIQALDGGQFQQNTRSGAISYVSLTSSCQPVTSFECLSEGIKVPQVVAASATAFADQLVAASPQAAATNPYLDGQWRTTPQASYSFRTSLTPDPAPRNYSFGTFSLQPFDWESSLRARPAGWLTAAITEQVAPQGDVLQEYDPLGIPSTAKFGYGVQVAGPGTFSGTLVKKPGHILPYLQAHNAEYKAVFFESFENSYSEAGAVTVEDGLVLPNNVQLITCDPTTAANTCLAHTGNACALLTTRQLQLLPIPLTTRLTNSGLLVKVWLRLPDYEPGQFTASISLVRAGASGAAVQLTTAVRTGNWQLFEARVPMDGTGASLGESLTPLLQFSAGGASAVYIDDVRVQPADAQMTAYVYDPVSLRLVASFDDQHFALLYQYNQEGKLIRKQAETARGLKTLQETHYHTPTTNQVNE